MTEDFIEKSVETVFDEFIDGLEAPVDIIKIANHFGFTVYQSPGLNDVSGVIMVDDKNIDGYDTNKVIIVNQKHPLERKRFTIAHELGHYFLEGRPEKCFARRDDNKNKHETNVNSFASSMLMPRGFITKDYHDFMNIINDKNVTIATMANKYQVSNSAMQIRLGKLRLI